MTEMTRTTEETIEQTNAPAFASAGLPDSVIAEIEAWYDLREDSLSPQEEEQMYQAYLASLPVIQRQAI